MPGLRYIMRLVSVLLALALLSSCTLSPATPTPVPTPTPTPLPIPASPDEVVRITPQELMAELTASKRVAVLDVRSRESFALKHITGALNVPSGELENMSDDLFQELLATLRAYEELVFYCT